MEILRVSNKEAVILEMLLDGREMYGLEMVKTSSKLKRGTVYVTLSRMEDKGFIKSREEEDPTRSGLPRRLYRVTGLGSRACRAVSAFARASPMEVQGA